MPVTMPRQVRVNDAVHLFMGELTSRIVAESGIPSDRHHLGKIILQSFKDAPDFVMQIDGGTNKSETNQSALERSVRCATALRNFGLGCGDVMVLMAPNHLDLGIPLYAALCLGIAVAAIDKELSVNELSGTFETVKPKIVFCQSARASDVQLTLSSQSLDAQIVTFDGKDHYGFSNFMEKYSDDTPVNDFKPTDFDTEETIAFLVATSGTTGLPKAAALTHKNTAISWPYIWAIYKTFPTPFGMTLVVSQLQWLTALFNFVMSPILRYTRLQTSQTLTTEHMYYLLNTYKPEYTLMSPTLFTTLIKAGDRDRCDFTSLEHIMLGGSAVTIELIEEIKKIAVNALVFNAYGISEIGMGLINDSPPPGSCGRPLGCLEYRLIDTTTGKDIIEPNTQGELWVKGPGVFKGYYNNPKATEEAFAEDRWFKTGDMFYRDDNWNFFFVERIKLMLKYKNHQISPSEVEEVIRRHPGVLDAAVVGIPDPECGELVVACVVRRPGHTVTAQDIKDLVKDTLTDTKQLRGGVIFMDSLPTTSTTKLHRRKLKELVLELERE